MSSRILFVIMTVVLVPGCEKPGPEKDPGIQPRPRSEMLSGKKLDPLDQWPQWRGPLATGVAPRGDPPVEWSEDQNIHWKITVPGKGLSTPIVWGDLILLTTAVAHGEAREPHHASGAHDNVTTLQRQKLMVLAINRPDGAIRWQQTVRDEYPHEGTHVTGSWASNSPVTDGEHLFAFFGSGGIHCLDMSGNVVWQKDLGDMQTKHGHGEGSSPALHGDTLVINWDHEGASFVIALEKSTGDQEWKVARDELSSWSTPLIVEHDGKQQVVVSATKRVRAYDLADGSVVWECGGLSGNVVASPVSADGIVYVANSYEAQAIFAIRLAGARGDITGSDAVLWSIGRYTPYVPSPLLYGDQLFYLAHLQGVLTCLRARTGEPLFGPRRLPGVQNVYASPVGAGGRVYIVDRNGTTVVMEQGGDHELLATNHLDDVFSASPAVVGKELYLRGERHLYCIK